jgi:hypothetical protein
LVQRLIGRLGAAGVILVASLVFFAFLGGAAAVHKLQAANAATVKQQGVTSSEADKAEQPDNSEGQSNSWKPIPDPGKSPEPVETSSESD